MRETNSSNMKPMRLGMNNEWTIQAAGGQLTYKTASLPLQSLMEELEEKLKKKSPLEIENAIKAL